MPITCAAGAGRRAGTRAGAVAGFAHGRARQIDLTFGAVKGFFQRDVNLGAQIRAAALLASTTTAPAAEKLFENIAHAAEIAKIGKATARARAGARAAFKGGVAELVIGRAALRVFQHLIGFGNLFEF